MKKLVIILICGLNLSTLHSQQYKIKSKWDKIAVYIDIKCISIDTNNEYIEGISEGENTSIRKSIEIYFLKSKDNKELHRIKYIYSNDSAYLTEIYYYNKNKVRKAIIETSIKDKEKNISYYYYFDDRLLKFIGKEPERSNSENIKKKAESFVLEFIK